MEVWRRNCSRESQGISSDLIQENSSFYWNTAIIFKKLRIFLVS